MRLLNRIHAVGGEEATKPRSDEGTKARSDEAMKSRSHEGTKRRSDEGIQARRSGGVAVWISKIVCMSRMRALRRAALVRAGRRMEW